MESSSWRQTELASINGTDWCTTPLSVQQLLLQLIQRLEEQNQQIASLQADNQAFREQIAAFQADNATLREQLNKNSENSSKSPSQDSPGFESKPKAKKGKPRGGQVGHICHERLMYEVDESDIIHHYPEQCRIYGEELSGGDVQPPHRHQVVDIPLVSPLVVEHRFHELICAACGRSTRAASQGIISQGGYGSRLSGLVILLIGQAHQSHRQVVVLLSEIFGVVLSTGMVSRLRRRFTESVQPAVLGALEYVRQQTRLGMDETGYSQGNSDGHNPQGRKGWLWVMTTRWVTYFKLSLSRSRGEVEGLLGPDYQGIVGSDRCGSYGYLPLSQRQICWAHLKRDMTAIAERSGVSREWGEQLLSLERDLFELWYDFRSGSISRRGLQEQVGPIRRDVNQILREATSFVSKGKTPLDRTGRTCVQILKVESALWTFVEEEGVEPTNNASERALRPAVLWRKVSLGVQSKAGGRFVASVLTVITSLRAQKRNMLDYLTAVFEAVKRGFIIPSLLPSD